MWIEPIFENDWTHYFPGYEVGYYKDKSDIIRFKGIAKGGKYKDGTVLFFLPKGYRPFRQKIFSVQGSGIKDIAKISIYPNGAVKCFDLENSEFIHFEEIIFAI